MSKAGAIILSRMGSSRLPGKAMIPLCGVTVLEHVVRRVERADGLDTVVVATTCAPQDDLIEHMCGQWGVACFRGDTDNVLKRCTEATRAFDLDIVVRIGGDSPLADSDVISRMLAAYRRDTPDYLSNTLDRSFPLGLDVEIFRAQVFERITEIVRNLPEAERRSNEENVIIYLHQHPEDFQLVNYKATPVFPDARLTLDTALDFMLIEKIYNSLYPENPAFGLEDIARLLTDNPNWMDINSGVVPVTGFWTNTEKSRFEKRFGKHHG